MRTLTSPFPLALLLASCATVPAVEAETEPAPERLPAAETLPPRSGAPSPVVPLAPVAESYVRGEWLQAENRAGCAPLAFGAEADRGGAPRPATFAGGWAVGFDLPERRSAYGIAGAGVTAPAPAELAEQWPYTLVPPFLPAGSLAGYGLKGAEAYLPTNPGGTNANSLAYVRVAGQTCLYNVWSRLGRAHLESMLGSLRLLG